MDQVLFWLLMPCEALQYIWTAVVFGITTALTWLLIPYDALRALPYFWPRAVFGIATGLLIPRKLVGLSVCVLGNAALYFCAGWNHGPSLPLNLMVLLT